MRITILTASVGLPFGQERVLALSAEELRRRGHTVEVLVEKAYGETRYVDKVATIPHLSSIHPLTPPKIVDRVLESVQARLTEFHPDIVHYFDFLDDRIMEVTDSFAPGVVTAHTVAPSCPAGTRQSRKDTYCDRKSGYACVIGNYRHGCLDFLKTDLHRLHAIHGFLKRSHYARKNLRTIFAISDFVKDILIQDGWPAEKVQLLENPVPVSQGTFSSLEKKKNSILVCSRLSALKGVDQVLQAAALLPAVDFEIRICGEGAERASLEALSQSLGLQNKVKWLGQQPFAQVAEEMAKASIYVQANRGPEAFGMALAEAMSWGCASIVSDIPALNQLVTPQNGLIFKKNSPEDLATNLKILLQDSEKVRSFGKDAWDQIRRHYSADRHVDNLLREYEKLSEISKSGQTAY